MFSILYPELLPRINELRIGVMPLWIEGDTVPKLIIKTSKETILTAKVNDGFSIYLKSYQLGRIKSLGFIAAFFDDQRSPMTIAGALFAGVGQEFRELLITKNIDVYFFDELGRELLGYESEIIITKENKLALKKAIFPAVSDIDQVRVVELLKNWFRGTGANEDSKAIAIKFKKSLLPEKLMYIDARDENNSYHGSGLVSKVFLERPEPGEYQEKDIIHLLQRVFKSSQIYRSPLRTYDKEEMVDILVVTESNILLVQAKDSPNIEKIIMNGIDRKRATIKKAIKKAIGQVRGAIGYLRRADPMSLLIDGRLVEFDLSSKKLYSIIVVKELFDQDYSEYASPLLKVNEDTGVPCVALSYGELHDFTVLLSHEKDFFDAYMAMFNYALETGVFCKLLIKNKK